MRLQIELNPVYAQQLLQNRNFRLSLTLTEDEFGNITKFWIENNVENNDEITFRALALNMVRNHFCTVFQELPNNVEVVTDFNQIPTYLLKIGASSENRLIASIIDFEL
jgi:hypothetical protein